MNLLVVVVDRLHAGFLGCYGNAWMATPHFNRLAAEGFVCDQAFVDQPDIESLVASWWSGQHCLERNGCRDSLPLAARLSQAGYHATCLTDEPLVASHPLLTGFDDTVRVGLAAGEKQSTKAAESVEETQMARLFAAATQLVERAREPFFLWLHARGMQGIWDAPYAFREQYANEDEAPPPTVVAPPQHYLSAEDDPDYLWGICQAYAGQVTLVDDCLGALWESLEDEQLSDDTLLVVLGARGFPLGRNGRLGDVDQALFGELVQTPWLMRLPGGLGAAGRSASLVQSCDLAPTLIEAVGGLPALSGSIGRSLLPLVREEALSIRDRILLAAPSGEFALRTPAWYLRLPAARDDAAEPPPAELYGKPDDRWEVNDVAGRCPDMVASLQAACDDLKPRLQSGDVGNLPALDDSLVSDLG